MSIMKNFNKLSPIHKIVFEARKSRELRVRWKTEFDLLAREYGLNDEEMRAVRECDLIALRELGVHPFYYNPIIRLTYGEDYDEYHLPASRAMKRAYGKIGDPSTYGVAEKSSKT